MPNISLFIEYPLNFDGSLRFSTDELRMYILANRLNFSVIKVDDEVLKKIDDYSQKIADYLPHTPVDSFGVNFLYKASNNQQLEELFQLPDDDFLTKDLSKIENINIARSFKLTDYTLNLTFSKNPGNNYLINFNYHFAIKDLVEFKGKIDKFGIIKLKNDSIEILKKYYNLELE